MDKPRAPKAPKKSVKQAPEKAAKEALKTGSKKGAKAPESSSDHKSFYIVGIGASAGGLKALKNLFGNIPKQSGMAFVVVVHLAPDRDSHLAEVLQPSCKIPVLQVTKTMPLRPDHVYVIPPNANLDSIDTHLRLSKLENDRADRAQIDHFLSTLATTHCDKAIGVILTGTGNDGTLGLKEIKERGGLTVVQEPADAEFDGMPQSAVSTGIADVIVPLAEIPRAILQYASIRPKLPHSDNDEVVSSPLFHKLMTLIKAHNGRDFNRYKVTTIERRVRRRMQICRITDFSAYLDFLKTHPDELDTLSDDMLITVTNFFRDPEVFKYLQQQVVKQLFKGKDPDDEIRIWSVGCATGEEAYSLAILFAEESAKYRAPPRFQIFASDLHQKSLSRAREGYYPGDIDGQITAQRLKKYFHQEQNGYRVVKQIRERVIFAPHNLLADPPFSRIDLICCRNLLIYIQRRSQTEIIELFHYALRPDGYMVLGSSENIDATDLFQLKSKNHCIYQKRNVRPRDPTLPVFPLIKSQFRHQPLTDVASHTMIVPAALHQRMAERFAPPSVLISPDDHVVHLSERAGRYLVIPGGEPTDGIFKLARDELRLKIKSMLAEARKKRVLVRSEPITVSFNNDSAEVELLLQPALDASHAGYVLLIFKEVDNAQEASTSKRSPRAAAGRSKLDRLERELNEARHRMQVMIEEYESGQEEMQASNEELQSANEELRSTMEELETSKEELQSMNEELQSVNQENRHKVEELAQLSGDLQNLLAATDIATLFLSRDLCIMRYTPKIEEIFNIRLTDRYRPLSDLTHSLDYEALEDDARQVLRKLVPLEREVLSDTGQWYLTRIMPYRSTSDHIEGVVITFVDITSRRKIENDVWESMVFAEQIIATMPEPLLVLASDLTVRTANTAFFTQFNIRPGHIEGRKIYEIRGGEWNIPALRKLLEDILPDNHILYGYKVDHEFSDLGRKVMLLNARRLQDQHLILLSFHDITGHTGPYTYQLAGVNNQSVEADAISRLRHLLTRLFISGDLNSALEEALLAVLELTGAPAGEIRLSNEATGKLEIFSQHGFSLPFLDHLLSAAIDDSSTYTKAMLSGKRVVVKDFDNVGKPDHQTRAALSAGFKAVQTTPLMSGENRFLGGTVTTYFVKPYRPSSRDLSILNLYTRQIADFVDQSRFAE